MVRGGGVGVTARGQEGGTASEGEAKAVNVALVRIHFLEQAEQSE